MGLGGTGIGGAPRRDRCWGCESPVPDEAHFCPTCERPTIHASPEERARWEVHEWRRLREGRRTEGEGQAIYTPAVPSSSPSSQPRAPVAPRTSVFFERLRGAEARAVPEEPAGDERAGERTEPESAAVTIDPAPEPILDPQLFAEPEPEEEPDPVLLARASEPSLEPERAPEPEPELPPEPDLAEEPARASVVVSEPAAFAGAERLDTFLEQVLRARHVVVDVGARTGTTTFAASRLVGGEGRVYAIDADPFWIDKVRERRRERGARNVVIVQARIAALDGFTVDGATGDPGPAQSSPLMDVGRLPVVHVRALDSLLAELGVARVDLLRVGAAAEAEAILQGARDLLSRPTFLGPVVVAVDLAALAASGSSVDAVLANLPRETWADSTGLRLGAYQPGAARHIRIFERR